MTKPNYPKTADTLKDRIIFITGAGDGIGKAVAKSCAAHGATVILTGRTSKKLEISYDEIIAAGSVEPLIFKLELDKLDDESAMQIAEAIYQEFGRLDGIVHNAAILGTMAPYTQYDSQLWQKVFQVNVHAPFILTKALQPLLQRSNNASIIFTGSDAGQQGLAYWGAYSASKFANEGMMQTLSQEFEQDKIKVNMIDPGVVKTKMRSSAFPSENPTTLPTAESITDAYIYLLSDDSKNINGQRINVWHKGTSINS